MKTAKLMKCALCAAILAVFALVGCEKLDTYSIDPPADLQSEIDSIAAAKASKDTGDTTYLDITKSIVGAEDYSSAWEPAVISDYFTIPTDQLLHLEFINHTSGENNWNNWNLFVANGVADREADDYKEYFVLRADGYGWGGGMVDEGYPFDIDMITIDYPDLDEDGDIWNDFRTIMDGAHVTLEVDHSATGNVFVTATAVGTDGTELVETYQQPVSATNDIVAYLRCDASYFEMKEAYLLPSEVTEIEDAEPESIAVEGAPSSVEFGNEDFWGNATATVTYADGSSEQVDTTDLSFNVIPDMSTLGEKTVIVSYNKTKKGELAEDAVSTYYTLEVTNPVASLEVTTMPNVTTYTFPGPAAPVFDPTGMEVTATYSDGTTGVIANENLQFEIPGADGAQDAVVSYIGTTDTVTTTVPITNVMGGTYQVGATDFSSGFMAEFSNDYNVASESTKTFQMDLYSSEAENWNSPTVFLRGADGTEYANVRMDNYGWGDGYDTATATNDWNWDVFAENLDGSSIEVTVTNVGDGTANVRYDVTYANGDTHFQLYEGITVDLSLIHI